MMTFREWAEKYCVDRGMWPEDARTVILVGGLMMSAAIRFP
jgi:hypothetical protein